MKNQKQQVLRVVMRSRPNRPSGKGYKPGTAGWANWVSGGKYRGLRLPGNPRPGKPRKPR